MNLSLTHFSPCFGQLRSLLSTAWSEKRMKHKLKQVVTWTNSPGWIYFLLLLSLQQTARSAALHRSSVCSQLKVKSSCRNHSFCHEHWFTEQSAPLSFWLTGSAGMRILSVNLLLLWSFTAVCSHVVAFTAPSWSSLFPDWMLPEWTDLYWLGQTK